MGKKEEKTNDIEEALIQCNKEKRALQEKLDESLFVLEQAKNKIAELEQSEIIDNEPIEEIKFNDEYHLKGSDKVKAKIEAIYPAGQSAAYSVNSAVIVIDGERCVLSQDLIKKMFCKV